MQHVSDSWPKNLFELMEFISHIEEYDELLHLLPEHINRLIPSDMQSILMINPATQNTQKTIMRRGQLLPDKTFHLLQTNLVGWVMHHQEPFYSDYLAGDDRFVEKGIHASGVGAAACVPLLRYAIPFGFLILLNIQRGATFGVDERLHIEWLALALAPYLGSAQQLQHYFCRRLPQQALIQKFKALGLLGESPTFIKLLQSIQSAAACDVRVLLEGHSGSGKELVARAIHKLSPRQPFPFVAVDCGAIPASLMESELFGHRKGAFTGAHKDHAGLVQEANKGTLFLDEINNLDTEMQAKLLRLLQEGEIRPLGHNKTIKVDVRVIAASSMSLTDLVEQHLFREDLFYRLHVYPIHVPDLQERQSDIPLLADHLTKKFAARQNKDIRGLHPLLIRFLKQRPWPGNVRELENFIERLVTLAGPGDTELTPALLPQEFEAEMRQIQETYAWQPGPTTLPEKLQAYEKEIIGQALAAANWNMAACARSLGISKSNMAYRMQKLQIQRPDRRD